MDRKHFSNVILHQLADLTISVKFRNPRWRTWENMLRKWMLLWLTNLHQKSRSNQIKTTRHGTESIYWDLSNFEHYWKFLSKQLKLKLKLEISILLEDKTWRSRTFFVNQKQELESSKKLLRHAMEIIQKQDQQIQDQSKPI